MRELGKYHARENHQWNGGKCSFHPSIVCSCGNYDDDDTSNVKASPMRASLFCPVIYGNHIAYDNYITWLCNSCKKMVYVEADAALAVVLWLSSLLETPHRQEKKGDHMKDKTRSHDKKKFSSQTARAQVILSCCLQHI